MRDNETIVTTTKDGKYNWKFEPDHIQQLRAQAYAIIAVNRIHAEALDTLKAEDNVRRQRIIEILRANAEELEIIIKEYNAELEKWKNHEHP